jgi:hypothetical protein
MKRVVIGVVSVAGTGVVVGRWLASRRRASSPVKDPRAQHRWMAVTINCHPDDVAPDGRLPRPLAQLDVEVRVEKAPGDRGTELYARPRAPVPTGRAAVLARLRGDHPREMVRTALRQVKSLIETGEVLRPDPDLTRARPARAGRARAKVVDMALARAAGEERL